MAALLDGIGPMCHIEHMVAITIRDLHMKTGAWVRKAALHDGIVVMDRKLPVARIIPFKEAEAGCSFADRELVKEFRGMRRLKVDSSHLVSEDRDRG